MTGIDRFAPACLLGLALAGCAGPTGLEPPEPSSSALAPRPSASLPSERPAPRASAGLPGSEAVAAAPVTALVAGGGLLATVEVRGTERALVVRAGGGAERGRWPLAEGLEPLAVSAGGAVLLAGPGKLALRDGDALAERPLALAARRGALAAARAVVSSEDESAACALPNLTCAAAVKGAAWSAGDPVLAVAAAGDAFEATLGPLGGPPRARVALPGPPLAAAAAGPRALVVTAAGLAWLDGAAARVEKVAIAPGLVAIAPDLSRVASFDGAALVVLRVGDGPPRPERTARGLEALVGLGFTEQHLWAGGPRGLVRFPLVY